MDPRGINLSRCIIFCPSLAELESTDESEGGGWVRVVPNFEEGVFLLLCSFASSIYRGDWEGVRISGLVIYEGNGQCGAQGVEDYVYWYCYCSYFLVLVLVLPLLLLLLLMQISDHPRGRLEILDLVVEIDGKGASERGREGGRGCRQFLEFYI